MRIRSFYACILFFSAFYWQPAAAQMISTPSEPTAPTDPAQCAQLSSEWAQIFEDVSRQHQDCLAASNSSSGGGSICSQPACQNLHCMRDQISALRSASVNRCREAVSRYQAFAAERQRVEAAEARRDAARAGSGSTGGGADQYPSIAGERILDTSGRAGLELIDQVGEFGLTSPGSRTPDISALASGARKALLVSDLAGSLQDVFTLFSGAPMDRVRSGASLGIAGGEAAGLLNPMQVLTTGIAIGVLAKISEDGMRDFEMGLKAFQAGMDGMRQEQARIAFSALGEDPALAGRGDDLGAELASADQAISEAVDLRGAASQAAMAEAARSRAAARAAAAAREERRAPSGSGAPAQRGQGKRYTAEQCRLILAQVAECQRAYDQVAPIVDMYGALGPQYLANARQCINLNQREYNNGC